MSVFVQRNYLFTDVKWNEQFVINYLLIFYIFEHVNKAHLFIQPEIMPEVTSLMFEA